MKKIIWLIVIFVLVLVTICVVSSLMITRNLERKQYEFDDDFKNIKIITDTADIIVMPSENTNSIVVCNEQEKLNHIVKLEDNTLLIKVNDTRKWYEYIGINFNTPKITIYLPKTEYNELLIKSSTGEVNIPKNFKFKNIDIVVDTGNITNYASAYDDIKIKTSTGNIQVENIIADTLKFSTSTGKVDVKKVNCSNDIKINVSTGDTKLVDTTCKNIISSGSTGNMSLENVIAMEKVSIERSTGNIKFKDSDANDIFIRTDTGDINGNLLTDKVFFVESDTGSVDVPKILADEKCEIITDTGNVKMTIR